MFLTEILPHSNCLHTRLYLSILPAMFQLGIQSNLPIAKHQLHCLFSFDKMLPMPHKRHERKEEKRDLYKKLSEEGFGLQQALSGSLAKHLRNL